MKIIKTDKKGRPCQVEFTALEALVYEIHDNLMDRGMSQGDAMIALRGSDIPPGLKAPSPILDDVLTPEFVALLTD